MNFIFFYPDEMRAQSLACYGNPLVKTPNFDALAQQGVRFDQCYVQNPVCSPSRCCMMTGLYPHNNGYRTLWHLLRDGQQNMLQYLKQSGYHIEWYGKNDLFCKQLLEKVVDQRQGPLEEKGSFGIDVQLGSAEYYSFLQQPVSEDAVSDNLLMTKAEDFIRNRKPHDKPFFLFLPLNYPHPPYSAPKQYYDMYNPEHIDIVPAPSDGKADLYSEIRKYRGLDCLSEQYLKKIQAVYLGMCSYSDMLLGRLLAAVEQSDLEDQTVIIASSDHGDWAGDYGVVEKWPTAFDDRILRVPLIIRTPHCKKGHVVKEQVESFDIMPTVLELAGIKCRHTHFARSLTQCINGANGDANRAVFAEGGYNTNEMHCFEGRDENGSRLLLETQNVYRPKIKQQLELPHTVCKAVMMRKRGYKLIVRSNGQNELYHLEQDADELTNLYHSNKYSDVVRELTNEMLKWYIDTADTVPLNFDERE